MPVVHRICSAKHADGAFTGEGARLYGGRWNEKGTRMVYCASSVSLAMLEVLVHSPTLPVGIVSITVMIPDDILIETWTAADLPADWAMYPAPAALQARGSAWAAAGRTLAVRVPSAVVPSETNILLNPVHPDWSRCTVHPAEPIAFDIRLKR
ncbi:MAG TPA: RES family NAD+ phosphorylase [Candidatus Nanopelagicales bacterium]|nr:RES family NAD+ phosphorylase [Candidatus Nanopelagicales bacterium]